MGNLNFIEIELPKALLNNKELISNFNQENEVLENFIAKTWEDFCLNQNIDKNEFEYDNDFIYTVRLRRNKQLNLNTKLFLIKNPRTNLEITEMQESLVSAVLLMTDTGLVKFFGLKELGDKTLPIRYIKQNQKYLLYELDKDLTFKSWGSLINPKNLSELSEAIFLVSKV